MLLAQERPDQLVHIERLLLLKLARGETWLSQHDALVLLGRQELLAKVPSALLVVGLPGGELARCRGRAC